MEVSPSSKRIVGELARAAEGRSLVERQLVERARQLIQARLKIRNLGPKGLFRDTAWDMMLELFISGEEGGILFVKQLVLASGETTASAMRRIDRLESAHFLSRTSDPLDQRRVIVRLTERGRSAMIAMLASVFEPPSNPDVTPISYIPRERRQVDPDQDA